MTDIPTLGLENKVALVTGGTRGLGLAIATRLCASGCDVYLNCTRPAARAEQAVRALDGLKGSATLQPGDVTDAGVLSDMLRDISRYHGRVDILVHNAVIFHPMAATAPVVGQARRDMAVAVDPLLHTAPVLEAVMGEGGRVLAVSSNGSGRAVPGHVSLGMAKGALESLVRYLAAELAGKGIAVNAVATARLDKGDMPGDPALHRIARRTPAGRATRPSDVADVVALLCTEEARWIHGQVITVDGGLSLAE